MTDSSDIATRRVRDIMTANPVTVAADSTVAAAAAIVRERRISCVLVTEHGALTGIVTTSDLVARVLAEHRDADTPVREVMTANPETIDVDALAHDALLALAARGVGHFPVLHDGRLVGIVTRSNLLAQQSASAGTMVLGIARAATVDEIAAVVSRVPQLLMQLVGSGVAPETIGRLITDVTDACTRRLISFAESQLGPAPVPWLWLACGSQGRREQTGVSDQDNCLIIHPTMRPEHDAWFASFARQVSDGLNACGFVYCPGDMMATNARWRQPLPVWEQYFEQWIRQPDPMAQMLASVMFDLRPIQGDESLFAGLQARTLAMARNNSIFVAHMVANASTHSPPLNFLGRLATIRSGEHEGRIDLKHAGVVPITDLARIYALRAELLPVNTRERLLDARDAAAISASGGGDLIDAYDLIARIRLEHQAAQIRRQEKPDNFMAPAELSDLERGHLRDAFVVVRTMQAALGQGRGLRS